MSGTRKQIGWALLLGTVLVVPAGMRPTHASAAEEAAAAGKAAPSTPPSQDLWASLLGIARGMGWGNARALLDVLDQAKQGPPPESGANVLSRNQQTILPNLRHDILPNLHHDILSGNHHDILSGNKTQVLSGNERKVWVLSNNQVELHIHIHQAPPPKPEPAAKKDKADVR